MKKSKIIASVLAAAMVVTSVPFANLSTSFASIGATANVAVSNNIVSGYKGDKTSLTRMVIDSNVTEITAGAFYGKDYPNLKEITVRGNNTVIGSKAFGYASASGSSLGSTFVVWCNRGSKAESYAKEAGLTIKYLNSSALHISDVNDYYYSGCGTFTVTTVSDTEDVVWQLDDASFNNKIVWFEENGKVVKETSGSKIPNQNGKFTCTAIVHVIDTNNKVNLVDKIKITANCRGTGSADTKEISIKKATKNINVSYLVIQPEYGTEDKQKDKLLGREVADGKLSIQGNVVDQGQLSDEKLLFYAFKGDLIIIQGSIDDDCNDVLSASYPIEDGKLTFNLEKELSLSNFFNLNDESGKISDSKNSVYCSIVDKNDNILVNENDIDDVFYIKDLPGTYPKVTISSANRTLSKVVTIGLGIRAKYIKDIVIGSSKYENKDKLNFFGFGIQDIEGSISNITVSLDPSTSTAYAKWTSDNENIAKVDGNTLTAVAPGDTYLWCELIDKVSGKNLGYYATIFYSVIKKVPYKEIVFAKDAERKETTKELYVENGKESPLYVCDARGGIIYNAGSGETAANEDLVYVSSDSKVLTVNEEGVITAKAVGVATITVYAREHTEVNANITVHVYTKATGIEITTIANVPNGQEKLIPYNLIPATSTEEVIWQSVNSDIATVSDYKDENGKRYLKVKANKEGSTTIKGSTYPSAAAISIQLTVEEAVHASSVTLNPEGKDYVITEIEGSTAYKIPVKGTLTLQAILGSASGKIVNDEREWYIEANDDFATTSLSGDTCVITAKKNGQFRVTLKVYGYKNGKPVEKISTVYIKVYTPSTAVGIYSESSPRDAIDLEYGATVDLNAKLTPNNSNDEIKWTCDKDFIKFSTNKTTTGGKVTVSATKTGTATITATAESGYVAKCTVNVYVSAKDFKFIQNEEEVSTIYVPVGEQTVVNLVVGDKDTSTDTAFTWTSTGTKDCFDFEPSADGSYAIFTGKKVASGCKINVKGNSSLTATGKTINVVLYQPITELKLASDNYKMYKGFEYNIIQDIKPAGNTGDVLTWKIEDTSVATIVKNYSSSGNVGKVVKALKPGTTRIILSSKSGKKAIATINVEAHEVVCKTKFTDVTYSGTEYCPKNLNVTYDDIKLKENTDYIVSYEDAKGNKVGRPTNVGTYKVILTKKGTSPYFDGSVVAGTFKIKAKSINTATVSAIPKVTYTGSAIKKTAVVKIKLGNSTALKTLSSVNDYNIIYTSSDSNKCIKPGLVKVTFKGKGNYTGSISTSYLILPLAPKSAKMTSCTTNSVKLSWDKSAGATGYNIYLVSGGKEKKIGSSATNSYTVTKLAAGKDYEYRIYAYVKVGSKYYNWTTYATARAGTKTATPVIATVKSTISKRAVLTWKKVTGASKYTVYYSTSKNGTYKAAGITTSTTYTVNNLKGNTTYYFKIKTERTIASKIYYSALSAVKSVKVKK